MHTCTGRHALDWSNCNSRSTSLNKPHLHRCACSKHDQSTSSWSIDTPTMLYSQLLKRMHHYWHARRVSRSISEGDAAEGDAVAPGSSRTQAGKDKGVSECQRQEGSAADTSEGVPAPDGTDPDRGRLKLAPILARRLERLDIAASATSSFSSSKVRGA
jgi:hypothetical protein